MKHIHGMLPDKIMIKGELYVCTKTFIEAGQTFDILKNQVTNEKKQVERKKLLKYLSKL